VLPSGHRYVGSTLVLTSSARIQLCGKLAVELDGRLIELTRLTAQTRVLLAFLTLNRLRPVGRDELAEVLWEDRAPESADVSLRALLSRLRATFGRQALRGKTELELVLPGDAWIDFEAAFEMAHRAEAAVAQRRWSDAWWPKWTALAISRRTFLPGCQGRWVDERRRDLADIRLRAEEAGAAIGLGLGGSELPSAERSARALIEAAPYRESGYRFLMEALAARGNVAEALVVYDDLRRLLRDELGASPAAATQALHRRLLDTEPRTTERPSRALKTVLFVDVVDSTRWVSELGDEAWQELAASFRDSVRESIDRFDGRVIDTAGDGIFATFDRPGEAIGAACSAATAVRELGIEVRAGVHSGECELNGPRVTGIAVHVGARVVAVASPGEVLVSSTVRDLVAGSAIEFADRGIHNLKGVPGEWRLFAVTACPTASVSV
jgi:class 3 adenylate cyclase